MLDVIVIITRTRKLSIVSSKRFRSHGSVSSLAPLLSVRNKIILFTTAIFTIRTVSSIKKIIKEDARG